MKWREQGDRREMSATEKDIFWSALLLGLSLGLLVMALVFWKFGFRIVVPQWRL